MSTAEELQRCWGEVQALAEHAWDGEVRSPEVQAWLENFRGEVASVDEERLYALFSLTRYMYFSKRLVREMLRSLYRDHFRAPLLQRLRRNLGGTRDLERLERLYTQELASTRFIGVGNPSESGAHLLYFFRQINRLSKTQFCDFHGAFQPVSTAGSVAYEPREAGVSRYVFFDDLVGSGTQVSTYLTKDLAAVRRSRNPPDVRFLSLFGTREGMERLNERDLFDGSAVALFELDDSFKACGSNARYFVTAPAWFSPTVYERIVSHYGDKLWAGCALGYLDGQLLLAFSHNTPDNVPPIYWNEGRTYPWSPVFIRFDKVYS